MRGVSHAPNLFAKLFRVADRPLAFLSGSFWRHLFCQKFRLPLPPGVWAEVLSGCVADRLCIHGIFVENAKKLAA